MRKLILILALILGAAPLQAAPEYLRFEGAVSQFYGPTSFGYGPTLGLVAGQPVYFDFVVDTAANAPGRPDTFYQNYFQSSYLGGAVATGFASYGLTSSFPEGINTWLFAANTLYVGSPYRFDNFGDASIATWVVGQDLKLMNNAYYDRDSMIGDVQLTYRGATAPPAIVPLPATAWLLLSAVALLVRGKYWLAEHRF